MLGVNIDNRGEEGLETHVQIRCDVTFYPRHGTPPCLKSCFCASAASALVVMDSSSLCTCETSTSRCFARVVTLNGKKSMVIIGKCLFLSLWDFHCVLRRSRLKKPVGK